MVVGLTAAIPMALTGAGIYVLLAAALLALVMVGTLCWTITDPERSERLAMLIDATRGNDCRMAPKLSHADLAVTEPTHDKAA